MTADRDDDASSVDAVVVGAGISGLAVADGLRRRGRSAVVLERRDRVGGRLRSLDLGDGALDLGASWFWPGEERVRRLVDELDLRTHPQFISGDALYHGPVDGSTEIRGHRLDGNPIDVPASRFSDGAEQLAVSLAGRLPDGWVLTGRGVTRVEQVGDRLRASVDDASYDAAHVVLALPPALAVHDIEFSPRLPTELNDVAASTPVWMGNVAKIVIRYERAFWRDAGLAGAAISHVGPLRELHDLSGPAGEPAALFGFAPVAPTATPPSDAAVLAQLTELFGADAPAPVDIVIAAWCDDVDTTPPGASALRGYSTYGHAAYRTAAFGGRLHWASTETASVAPGHIEGALAAAERTVDAIDAQLSGRRAVLTDRPSSATT